VENVTKVQISAATINNQKYVYKTINIRLNPCNRSVQNHFLIPTAIYKHQIKLQQRLYSPVLLYYDCKILILSKNKHTLRVKITALHHVIPCHLADINGRLGKMYCFLYQEKIINPLKDGEQVSSKRRYISTTAYSTPHLHRVIFIRAPKCHVLRRDIN
jgi:hypothetical protein